MKNKDSKLVYSTDPELRQKIENERKSPAKSEIVNITPDQQHIKIMLQTKGRRGKQVTLILGFQHDKNTLNELARTLKQICSAGGTVKGQDIEIQGDKRKVVVEKLMQLGYHIKFV